MTDVVLAKRRVDPNKIDQLRNYFDSLDERRDVFERGLELEHVNAEAAFLKTDGDEPVLYYYMERSDEYPPDIDPDDIEDEAIRELSREHAATLDEVCIESARDEAGNFRRLETLFFATSRNLSD